MGIKAFFKKAFGDMKESAKAQHEVDKAEFQAAKAEAKANFEENKFHNTYAKAKADAKKSWDDAHMSPSERTAKIREENAARTAAANVRTGAANARYEALAGFVCGAVMLILHAVFEEYGSYIVIAFRGKGFHDCVCSSRILIGYRNREKGQIIENKCTILLLRFVKFGQGNDIVGIFHVSELFACSFHEFKAHERSAFEEDLAVYYTDFFKKKQTLFFSMQAVPLDLINRSRCIFFGSITWYGVESVYIAPLVNLSHSVVS